MQVFNRFALGALCLSTVFGSARAMSLPVASSFTDRTTEVNGPVIKPGAAVADTLPNLSTLWSATTLGVLVGNPDSGQRVFFRVLHYRQLEGHAHDDVYLLTAGAVAANAEETNGVAGVNKMDFPKYGENVERVSLDAASGATPGAVVAQLTLHLIARDNTRRVVRLRLDRSGRVLNTTIEGYTTPGRDK